MVNSIEYKISEHVLLPEAEGRYTFFGAYRRRYKDISDGWNDATKKKYDSSIRKVIIPNIKDHNFKALEEYTKEDYEAVIERITENGYMDGDTKKYYEESTMHMFRFLIWRIVLVCSYYGMCNNVLWDSKYQLDDLSIGGKSSAYYKLKKSLTVNEEKKLYERLASDCEADGEIIGLLLMFSIGLRNAESCGLNYGDIEQLMYYEDVYVAWIYKSTIIDSNELQSSGKTYNSGRLIPMPDIVVQLILNRKEKLRLYLLKNGLEDIEIDKLPIACHGNMYENYSVRCKASDISNAACGVFDGIVSGRTLAMIDKYLLDENSMEVLREKDPTAYLLRRNFATHLSILNFEKPVIQYLMGHDIEDPYETRNEYMDEDRLYQIALKLKNRPLLNESRINKEEYVIETGEELHLKIKTLEPMDELKIEFSNKIQCEVKRYTGYYEHQYNRTVDIVNYYRKQYK